MSFRTKTPDEDLLFNIPFANLLGASESVDSIETGWPRITPVTHPAQLSVSGSAAVDSGGTGVDVRLTGGVSGRTYRVAVLVNTSASNKREAFGTVKVKDI